MTAPHALCAPSWPRTWGLVEARPRPPGGRSVCHSPLRLHSAMSSPRPAPRRLAVGPAPLGGPANGPAGHRPSARSRLWLHAGVAQVAGQAGGQGAWQGQRARPAPPRPAATGCGGRAGARKLRARAEPPARALPPGWPGGGPRRLPCAPRQAGAPAPAGARWAPCSAGPLAHAAAPDLAWAADGPGWPGAHAQPVGALLAGARLLHSQPGAGTGWSAWLDTCWHCAGPPADSHGSLCAAQTPARCLAAQPERAPNTVAALGAGRAGAARPPRQPGSATAGKAGGAGQAAGAGARRVSSTETLTLPCGAVHTRLRQALYSEGAFRPVQHTHWAVRCRAETHARAAGLPATVCARQARRSTSKSAVRDGRSGHIFTNPARAFEPGPRRCSASPRLRRPKECGGVRAQVRGRRRGLRPAREQHGHGVQARARRHRRRGQPAARGAQARHDLRRARQRAALRARSAVLSGGRGACGGPGRPKPLLHPGVAAPSDSALKTVVLQQTRAPSFHRPAAAAMSRTRAGA